MGAEVGVCVCGGGSRRGESKRGGGEGKQSLKTGRER